MKSKTRKRIIRIGLVLLMVYLFGGIVLYFIQDKILFHPKSVSKHHQFSFKQPFEEVNILFKENNVNIVKFKTVGNRKGIVLFYHGNMENVEHYKKYPAYFLRNNYEIWMIDYPGFGKTTGKLSETNLYEQGLIMYDLASKQINSDSIIIYGKSIGTGIASYVASVKNCSQLILETPYYSIPSLAKHYFPIYPVRLMIKYNLPVYQYLKKVKAPITILHGTKDEIVPYRQSVRLKKENSGIELVRVENGKHNNLSEFTLFQLAIDNRLVK